MNESISINTPPFGDKQARSLRAGDVVLLSGRIYTARDAAHARLCDCIEQGKDLPLSLNDQILYFTGPTPAKPGSIIGSAGPTTSARMDSYSPLLIQHTGLRGMIGKGDRSGQVIFAMKKYGCVYFAATGGAGALIAQSILKAEIVCYEDLGPEAVFRLTIKNFPLIVAIDSTGNSLYTAKK
jgi:fumarate hydratase subunit beta